MTDKTAADLGIGDDAVRNRIKRAGKLAARGARATKRAAGR